MTETLMRMRYLIEEDAELNTFMALVQSNAVICSTLRIVIPKDEDRQKLFSVINERRRSIHAQMVKLVDAEHEQYQLKKIKNCEE